MLNINPYDPHPPFIPPRALTPTASILPTMPGTSLEAKAIVAAQEKSGRTCDFQNHLEAFTDEFDG